MLWLQPSKVHDRFVGRSCRGRKKFGEDSGGEIEIAGASRFSSNGYFAIKTVQFDGHAGCTIAGSERRIDVFSQTSSRRVRSSTRPWVPIARRFCSSLRRGRRAVDAGSPVGHAGCNNSWECPRVGETVPSCGECSGGFVTDIKSVNGRVHRQCDRTALCSGEISVQIARSPSGGGFEPRSQEEAPSCDVQPRSIGQVSRVGWRWHADPEPRHNVGGRERQANSFRT